jgi:hypothetical protein
MGSNARIAMAVGLGYLLGRRKKMRTAMAVGAAIAAGRVSRNPASLLQRGGELLGNTPALGQLSGLSKPLADAGKAAAAGMVSRGIESMGDRIRQRTDSLRINGEPAEHDDEDTADERERPRKRAAQTGRSAAPEPDDDDYDDYDEEPEDEPAEKPRPRRAPPRSESGNGGGSRSPQGERAGAPIRRRVSKR